MAGALSLFLGLGFGIPCAFGIRHFAQTGQVWTFLGFPTYGEGPFEQVGLNTSTALLAGFLAVCVAEVALAVLLWTDAPHAAALSYALLPIELTFWIGFALPLGPPLGIARTVLVALAPPSTHRVHRAQALKSLAPSASRWKCVTAPRKSFPTQSGASGGGTPIVRRGH